jgi:hypothetical protein
MADTWEYTDEQAQMLKRIEALERAVAELKAAVERVAEYQGVKHLLAPQ